MNWGQKTWFITGASSGIGRAFAHEVLAQGGRVIATSRHVKALSGLARAGRERLLEVTLDVTDEDQVNHAVQLGVGRFGSIDVLLNNAGHGFLGSVEETTLEEARRVFDVNLFGAISLTRAALPVMRAAGSGWIINISSIGGITAGPGGAFYCGSKFALEAFSESLRKEIEPFGLRVLSVEPGPFRTDFMGRSLVESKRRMPEYEQTVGATLSSFRRLDNQQSGDPTRAATIVVQVLGELDPPSRLLLGRSASERARDVYSGHLTSTVQWAHVSAKADFSDPDRAE